MLKKLWFLTFCAVMLAGCSAVQPPSNVSKLQVKIAHLERRVEENDKRIQEAEFRTKQISEQVEGLEAYQDYDSVVEVESKETVSSGLRKTTISSVKRTGIIRVSVSSREVQKALKNAGYYDGVIDGKIGRGTTSAIEEFQKDHDLVSDGVVGKKTWAEMKNYLE